MKSSVEIIGKRVEISLTSEALKAIESSVPNLIVEMELYFSCLIRKRVLFRYAAQTGDATQVQDKLYVQFRPVMTNHCGVDYEGDEPPLTEFPIKEPAAFVPKWLKLDYRKGKWVGEFGF